MYHPYHLVSISPWPLFTSLSLLITSISLISLINNIYLGYESFFIGIILLIINLSLWYRDVIRESSYIGDHTYLVSKGLLKGFLFFILSEIMVFFSFIWATYYLALSPSIELGCLWPPVGIVCFNPYTMPLLNTLILLSSGCSITWAHHSLFSNKKKEFLISTLFTIILGLVFSLGQYFEYNHAMFNISSSVWGSTFFMTTGLHGVHVIIGTMLLIFSLIRTSLNHFSINSHLNIEVSILYWHFVDLVWLLVFATYYLWV